MTEDKVDALSLTDDEESEEENLRYPEKKGVLSKWTNYLHGWQDRYIVLKDGALSYYKSQNDLAFGCRGAVSLSRATITVRNVGVGIMGGTISVLKCHTFFFSHISCENMQFYC